jgi:hypothetical protein
MRSLPGWSHGASPVRCVLRHGWQLWFGCESRLCVEEAGEVGISIKRFAPPSMLSGASEQNSRIAFIWTLREDA